MKVIFCFLVKNVKRIFYVGVTDAKLSKKIT